MDNGKLIGSIVGNIVSFTGLGLSVENVNNVVGMITSIIGLLITIISVAFAIYEKVKKAKADGNLTHDEIKEISDTVKDGVDKISEQVENINKGGNKDER